MLNKRMKMDFEKLKTEVPKIVFVDNNTKPTFEEQLNIPKEYWDLTVGKGTADDWYCLLRNAQGTIEPYYNGTLRYMMNSPTFIKDSLFCEWAYIVNLDTMKFEIWRGFQKEPWPGNRYGVELKDGYYPCKLVMDYDLDKLPTPGEFIDYFEVLLK